MKALFLSCEPTIDELIKRPLTVSKASLHEFILMKLKEVTLDYSKTLKKAIDKDRIPKI